MEADLQSLRDANAKIGGQNLNLIHIENNLSSRVEQMKADLAAAEADLKAKESQYIRELEEKQRQVERQENAIEVFLQFGDSNRQQLMFFIQQNFNIHISDANLKLFLEKKMRLRSSQEERQKLIDAIKFLAVVPDDEKMADDGPNHPYNTRSRDQ